MSLPLVSPSEVIAPGREVVPWIDGQWGGYPFHQPEELYTRERESGVYLTLDDFITLRDDQMLARLDSLYSIGVSFESFSRSMKSYYLGCLPFYNALAMMWVESIGRQMSSSSLQDVHYISSQEVYYELYMRKEIIEALELCGSVTVTDVLFCSVLCTGTESSENIAALVHAVNELGMDSALSLAIAGIPPTLMIAAMENDIDPSLISAL